jgi:hypothetical protein
MPRAARSSLIDDFVRDANASAMGECAVIIGVIGLIVGLVALVLDHDIWTLLSAIGIFLAGIPLPG